MKREHVVPDLLASITADALFGGAKPSEATPARKQGSTFSLRRWLESVAGPKAAAKSPEARLTLDDDWVGGWYARTRLLQAATLAQMPERAGDAANPTPNTADADRPSVMVDVLTQVKDFS